jgi:hypothetical protein
MQWPLVGGFNEGGQADSPGGRFERGLEMGQSQTGNSL